ADDGAWQFHPNLGPTSEKDAAVMSLKSIIEIDETILSLADLPQGWNAWRESKSSPWIRTPQK
ncbi:MAG: hypothetical protein ACREJ2_17225, partial [Planctomycetota bacterium]